MIHLYYFRASDYEPGRNGDYFLFLHSGEVYVATYVKGTFYKNEIFDSFQVPKGAFYENEIFDSFQIPIRDIKYFAEVPSMRVLDANEGREP